ncbi:MAG: penicillin-binding protein activator LpoB [Myxococcota bacterium]|jgi:penicillin-binding protein activator|nr:penicillin-binding protein activator LpoB [Myxococcota bacterium]
MLLLRAWSVCILVGLVGCGGPKAVRGDDVAGLDDQAMSTGLDRRDLQKMLHENMQALQTSAVVKSWEAENRPAVAVIPLRNETSEHIDSSIDALLADIETTLVNAGHVRVISMEQQPALVEEIKRQYSGAFDPSQIAGWGKQVGARYVVTGRVYSNDERQSGERRVQYFMFIQVLNVETGEILFQHKTAVTKAII